MDDEIECTECGWQGYWSELFCSDEDAASDKLTEEISFNLCPDCGGYNCFESIEDGYEED